MHVPCGMPGDLDRSGVARVRERDAEEVDRAGRAPGAEHRRHIVVVAVVHEPRVPAFEDRIPRIALVRLRAVAVLPAVVAHEPPRAAIPMEAEDRRVADDVDRVAVRAEARDRPLGRIDVRTGALERRLEHGETVRARRSRADVLHHEHAVVEDHERVVGTRARKLEGALQREIRRRADGSSARTPRRASRSRARPSRPARTARPRDRPSARAARASPDRAARPTPRPALPVSADRANAGARRARPARGGRASWPRTRRGWSPAAARPRETPARPNRAALARDAARRPHRATDCSSIPPRVRKHPK